MFDNFDTQIQCEEFYFEEMECVTYEEEEF
jgi:hypothetical protein